MNIKYPNKYLLKKFKQIHTTQLHWHWFSFCVYFYSY